MLQQLLPRLINLHSFCCDISLPNVPRILLRTTESRRVPLRTLDLLIAEDYRPFDQVSEDYFGLKDVPLDHWPALSSLGFHIYSNSNAPYDGFFKHTVLHSQHHLRALSLSVRHEILVTVWDVLSRIPVFRCLEKLQTSLPVKFLMLPCFTQAPRLKSLNIHYFGSTTAWPPLRETDYRALEVLSCPARASRLEMHALNALLPDVAQGYRRPIHTLRLGDSTYGRYRGTFYPADGLWDGDAPTALAYIARYGAPMRHLGIHLPENAIDCLTAPDIKPHLAHLESLDARM